MGVHRVLAYCGKKMATRLPLAPVIVERMNNTGPRAKTRIGSCIGRQLPSATCTLIFFHLGKLILRTDALSRALLNSKGGRGGGGGGGGHI